MQFNASFSSTYYQFEFITLINSNRAFCTEKRVLKYGFIYNLTQGKGTLFRNIQDTDRWNYSALGSRQVPIVGWVPMS
jgi:hypothetical protein